MEHYLAIDAGAQALVNQQLAEQDGQLRQQLLATLVLPHLARLRGGNDRAWNEAGWYRAQASRPAPAPFPVPSDCAGWYALEHDDRSGSAYRFFRRQAWLTLAAPQQPCHLSFNVVHAVLPEALAQLTVTVCGVTLAAVHQPWPDACARLTVALDAALVARAQAMGALALQWQTPVAGTPALLHADSADWRCLSLAVSWPALER